jgi:hypothetical protein
MSEKRIILEMGTGNDLYGQDYTKAARRAAQDLPRGRATVRAVKGGLNVTDPASDGVHVVVTAAIEAWLPDQSASYKLSS